MIELFLSLYALTRPSPVDVEAFRQSAPVYLTEETAADHLVAARLAGRRFQLDPDLLLAIAYHESRYTVDEVTPEVGGKVSCGVMTPVPTKDKDSCPTAESNILGGYLDGSAHLAGWIRACGGRIRCALLGYAAGYSGIARCKEGPVLRFVDHGDDLCQTPSVFLSRARYIRSLRSQKAGS
jgi:hypothetical protein